MELSNISTVVRPRSKWQAIDLGFKMASQWYKPLILGWLVISLPIFILLHLLLPNYSWLALILFWWLKPLWERIQLVYLSAAQFGQHLGLKQQLHRWRGIAGRQLLATLFWRRLSLQRSYSAPIMQLENLSGARRQKRKALFVGNNQQAAFWLTLVLLHLESFITIAAYALLMFLIPTDIETDLNTFETLASNAWLSSVLMYLSMACVAPFFVASGFSLYLNQRTQIEGWDIEITFRRMVGRHQQQNRKNASKSIPCVLAMLMCIGLCSLLTISPSSLASPAVETQSKQDTSLKRIAIDPQQQAIKQIALAVAADEHFNQQETISYPEFILDWTINQDQQQDLTMPDWLKLLVKWLANSVELILTTLVVSLGLLLLYRYRHWLAQYLPINNTEQSPKVERPSHIFGLDMDGHSLPNDPAAHAKQLWQQGQKRQSLSLLYRASLFTLVNNQHLTVHDSFTEGECVAQVRHNTSTATADYFAQLTKTWQGLAYAGKTPNETLMNDLFSQWDQVFMESVDES